MSQRVAGLALCLIGTLVFIGSFATWGTCPTTPCGGILQAFSEYSGTDLGFGTVTALAGLALVVIGIASLVRPGRYDLTAAAAMAASAIVAGAVGSILWMFVLPGDDKEFVSVPFTAAFVAILGLISLGLSRSLPWPRTQVSGNSPT